ncbi:hypothetical protein AAFN86_11620 [Roseomonas sp. CAU 1739]|uniref:hypothetical protein n=1 Tax=Roseomonas sp. CAU 1739 TaxID=3140364 RepID=UPI00325A65AE
MMAPPDSRAPVADWRSWNFAVELEHTIPHQIALPDLDEEGVRLALGLVADRFTPIGNSVLRIERAGRPGAIRLDLLTLQWVADPCGTQGHGILEAATWLRRRTLIGTACMLGLAVPLLRRGR